VRILVPQPSVSFVQGGLDKIARSGAVGYRFIDQAGFAAQSGVGPRSPQILAVFRRGDGDK
ncbi:MAG TPA: hypothetical protein VLZ81_06700, partial [Blastocatellia bacterium]|nr:hypothetical protein [Blastocatellia bacterium]